VLHHEVDYGLPLGVGLGVDDDLRVGLLPVDGITDEGGKRGDECGDNAKPEAHMAWPDT
jgi:hypothetical protein